jgi:hypothetical protein
MRRRDRRLVAGFQARVDPQVKPLPPDSEKNRTYATQRKQRAPRQPSNQEFDLRTEVYKLFGVDVSCPFSLIRCAGR